MSTHSKNNPENQEIDLAVLSQKMGSALQNLNTFIFNCIQFALRNIVLLLILIIVGVGLGFYLDQTQKTYDNEVIVSPNFGSVDYLYAKVELIKSKLKEKDTTFLKAIGIAESSKLSKIEIKPIIDVYSFVGEREANFELLKLMAEDDDMRKVLEDPATSKNYRYHLISFTTKKLTSKAKTVQPLLDFLNNSTFFTKIQKEQLNNIQLKMKANEQTITQIDNFLNSLSEKGAGGASVFINENTQLNDVIKTKDELVREQGNHRINLVGYDKIIKESTVAINIENSTSVNGKLKFVFPLIFVGIFLGIYFFRSFYRKQKSKIAPAA